MLFFRNPSSGKLKKQFTFIVDNGPAESPFSIQLQLCLVRLLRFLNLDRIVQVSFAEYHSKQNYVERVHAEENRALSKHGPFSSKIIHKKCAVGSKEHYENMEKMEEEVCRCLNTATFGKKAFQCYRGVRQQDFVFADEQTVHEFLTLSEENKAVCTTTYTTLSSTVTRNLNVVWGIEHFSGSYYDDYKIIKNNHKSCPCTCRTAWKDTTAIYGLDSNVHGVRQYKLQPLPDYIRWKETGELHYLPFNERVLLDKGDWDNCPGLVLPTRVLNLCFAVVPHPTDDCLKEISKLA